MERVSLPKVIPSCAFTQEVVQDAVRTMCGHFFEKKEFEEYGGMFCPLCKREITWYVDVPKDRWGSVVKLERRDHKIKRRPLESHVEHEGLEHAIATNLICVALAHGNTSFRDWCNAKDTSIVAPLNYDKERIEATIQGMKKYPFFVKNLCEAFEPSSHETVQSFINAFLKEKSHFELYNLLMERVFIDQIYEGVRMISGQSRSDVALDEEKVIIGAERGKKLRALIGLTFALCLIIGLSRRILSKTT